MEQHVMATSIDSQNLLPLKRCGHLHMCCAAWQGDRSDGTIALWPACSVICYGLYICFESE